MDSMNSSLFLDRVGIVEAQVTAPGEFPSDAEVETNGFGMTDMEITVRLGREPGDHVPMTAGVQVRADDVADEIPAVVLRRAFCFAHSVQLRNVGSTVTTGRQSRVCVSVLLSARKAAARQAPVVGETGGDDRPRCPNGQGMCSCSMMPGANPAGRRRIDAEFAIASPGESVYPNKRAETIRQRIVPLDVAHGLCSPNIVSETLSSPRSASWIASLQNGTSSRWRSCWAWSCC